MPTVKYKNSAGNWVQIPQMIGIRISSSGGLPTLTSPAAPNEVALGKQFIDSLGDVQTGTLQSVEQASPTISVSSNGLITASVSQLGGIISSGKKSSTSQLTTKNAEIFVPSTSNKIIPSNVYLIGEQTIKGDSNLVPENIAAGVSIFGVQGSYFVESLPIYKGEWESSQSYDTGEIVLYMGAFYYANVSNSNSIPSAGNDWALLASDNDLVPYNIRSGINVYGIEGTYSGDGGIDTSDATAQPSDIVDGKTAYVAGQKIVGIVDEISSSEGLILTDTSPTSESSNLRLSVQLSKDKLIRAESYIAIDCAKSLLGNAATSDVVQGKTFTSTAGIAAIGTIPDYRKGEVLISSSASISEDVYHSMQVIKWIDPYYSNGAIFGSETTFYFLQTALAAGIYLSPEMIVSGYTVLGIQGTGGGGSSGGIDTSDATAVSNDIVYPKTAYVNGVKITGSIDDRRGGTTITDALMDYPTSDEANKKITFSYDISGEDIVVDETTLFSLNYSDIVGSISLTSDKIVSGNTVLGIQGTGGGSGSPIKSVTVIINTARSYSIKYISGNSIYSDSVAANFGVKAYTMDSYSSFYISLSKTTNQTLGVQASEGISYNLISSSSIGATYYFYVGANGGTVMISTSTSGGGTDM